MCAALGLYAVQRSRSATHGVFPVVFLVFFTTFGGSVDGVVNELIDVDEELSEFVGELVSSSKSGSCVAQEAAEVVVLSCHTFHVHWRSASVLCEAYHAKRPLSIQKMTGAVCVYSRRWCSTWNTQSVLTRVLHH